MLCLGWLLPKPSCAFDDSWSPVFDSALVINILSDILKSV
jgi:hypothetical protein